ncbi:3-hydroxy-3-methylglutaryl-coenzyme A reductase [Carnobacterium iners]|uniref:3-hydroxy-3-methylglutaryl coenzyme A reductase n=1 Tax=Carnobacterium iners TaxID=1073423 RepID=A0A1X7N7H6_9LACT|nr:hydroxymethylglutaryl-CoA reductase, degradative [Carnobacterium iners]SEL37320.1 3-hydroxy-3-methylglutaryl-coenzyme A reductase [Carnobacterium iners]SMH32493.1 3-hydroxy-3-methylglutaryl-coenzyme A reductase [Carnobacterium iners]
MTHSHFSEFYKKTKVERIKALLDARVIQIEDALLLFENSQLTDQLANHMIENQLTQYSLPLGVALHFLIDNQTYQVPMVTEEPSVIAAASAAAKVIAQAGGFKTHLSERKMIGQVALKDIPDLAHALEELSLNKEIILKKANNAHPSIVKRGGGADEVEFRTIPATEHSPTFLVVHVHIDVLEAMGANIVNTMMEAIASYIETLTDGKVLMSILSNYATECLATATCQIPLSLLERGDYLGEEVRDAMIEASQFAYVDPYRATTHNKGIMNGIDAVVLASGNDWRAIEAGAHAYAARSGQYRSLSIWEKADNGDLKGSLTLPLPVGFVGGSIGIHPTAQFSQRLLSLKSAKELESVIVSVGLAQNFAALRALVTEGIQKGHMGLQAKSLAISAGASGNEIEHVANELKKQTHMNLETAISILDTIKNMN